MQALRVILGFTCIALGLVLIGKGFKEIGFGACIIGMMHIVIRWDTE